MRNKVFIPLLTLVICFLTPPIQAQTKLIDLIPGLYGGDGILLATAPTASHTAHFSIESAASINRLNQQIAAEIGGFPFSSSVGGFSFEFDPVLGDFVGTTKTLGPILAERAATLGRGKLNLNLSYTFLNYNKFSGQSLDKFDVTARHDTDIVGLPDVREQFENDIVRILMDININTKILAFSGTYGVLDRLDLGFLVPLAQVDVDVKSVASVDQSETNTLFNNIHTFDNGLEAPQDNAKGNATGIGDIVLRAKYHLPDNSLVDIGFATLAQLSTGDNQNFLGTGDNTIYPFFIFSRSISDRLTPHANIGYEFNLTRSKLSALEYAIGFDYGTNKYTVAGDFLASNELDGDSIGDNILETAWGIKWNPARQYLVALNTQFALNDAGLRSTFITTLSLEYNF
ncbi:MAG: hypothetical protein ACI8V2_002004 [Candidatus Latescibacterota bacterium]|jgi:hypothetical protein